MFMCCALDWADLELRVRQRGLWIAERAILESRAVQSWLRYFVLCTKDRAILECMAMRLGRVYQHLGAWGRTNLEFWVVQCALQYLGAGAWECECAILETLAELHKRRDL